MAISPIATPGGAFMAPSYEMLQAPTAGSTPFSGVVQHFLSGAAESHAGAQAAVRDFAMGQTDNLHGVMLQVAQADLSFRLILEIRNRLTEAYQEITKMQV